MSEHMAAELWIGGRISPRLVPELCRLIGRSGVGLEYGEYNFRPDSPQELLDARVARHGRLLLALHDDQARWGEFDALERFLREHAVAYSRQSDGRYEYMPERVEFRPPDRLEILVTDTSHRPVVAADKLEEIEQLLREATTLLDAGQAAQAGQTLARSLGSLREKLPSKIPPLETLEIAEPCECERLGHFSSGVPGILAHVEHGRVAPGTSVERCDQCERYPSDEAAREKLVELGMI